MKTFYEWLTTESSINKFEMNGEDYYAVMDMKTKYVYAIGSNLNGLILDFNWNNNKNDIDITNFRVVIISEKDYKLIHEGKKLKIDDYFKIFY